MKTNAFLISILLLTSCSNYNVSNRVPSSVGFETFFNTDHSDKIYFDKLEQLKSLYLRAESGLSDFDRELDLSVANSTPLTFQESRSYRRMVAIWNLNHQIQNELESDYGQLKGISSNKNSESDKKQKADYLLTKIDQKLNSTDDIEMFAFEELKKNLGFSTKYKSSINSNGTASIYSKNFVSPKLSLFRKLKDQFKKNGKKLENSNDELNQQIDHEAQLLQFDTQEGREPQQVADKIIFPSPDRRGVITGNTFPKNTWALTYDDGPSPDYTPFVLKNLVELGIKATFFWQANHVLENPTEVQMAHDYGMPRENHSFTHYNLIKSDRTEEILNREINESTDVDIKAYGEKPLFFRCPYGNSDPHVRQMIAALNMVHVYWNVDTLDWQDNDPDSIVARAQKQMKALGHGIVLFHDVHPQSVAASKKLIEWSKTFNGTDQEMRWLTIPQIVDEINNSSK